METIRDRMWEKAGQEGIPLTAAFELLPVCNLHCRMCYVRKSMSEVQKEGGLLSGDRWIEIARECLEMGLMFPLLTGGEPLLHPDFRQIHAGMQELGAQVSINSNGTMIDRETAYWFGRHCPVRINMTLYGASEDTYERLCGNGAAFEKVRNAVQWLKEADVPVKFNASMTPENIDDLDAIMDYAKKVESPIQVATYMFPPYRRDNRMIGQNDRLSPEEAGYARVKSDYLQAEPDWFMGQVCRFARFVPFKKLKLGETGERELRISCRAGNASLWLDWRGRMSTCGMYGFEQEETEGRTLQEAWVSLREKTHAFRYKPVCGGCPNFKLCHPCIAMVHNECGSGSGRPEYICRLNEAASRYYLEFARKYYPDLLEKYGLAQKGGIADAGSEG